MLSKRAVVLWTGGKDCNLALFEAIQQGYEIVSLLSFVPLYPNFKAHPIRMMQQQANALEIPHAIIPISEPYKESYEAAILKIKEEYGIDNIVTGDIAGVHGNTNWISDRSISAGVNVFLPLWHLNREEVLNKLIALRFKVIFSCVKEPWLSVDWLGKEMNAESILALKELHLRNGMDICGEAGEYHTLVLDGPLYKKSISIDSFISRKEDALMYMDIAAVSLFAKCPYPS